MSGVYIKGMQMPESCAGCPACHSGKNLACEYWLFCGQTGIKLENVIGDGKPDWCPLIPVSDHGKLIDADKLIARLERQRTVILHNLPEVHAMEEGYTKEDYIFERNGDMVSILRNQAGVIPSDMEDSKE